MTIANSSSSTYTQRIEITGTNAILFYALLSAGNPASPGGIMNPISRSDIKNFVINFV